MFYVSCIVSQLVYSLGGSGFKGGLGSEMVSYLLSKSNLMTEMNRLKWCLSFTRWHLRSWRKLEKKILRL